MDTYVISSSFGNDSVALIQYFHENIKAEKVYVVFCDTGWAAPWWQQRVEQGMELARKYGFEPVYIKSEGMEQLVRRKKGFPAGGTGMAFCTAELKVKPFLTWLDSIDTKGEFICVTGVRREESRNRRTAPMHVEESERHGGRELYQPLVCVQEQERNKLVEKAGFKVLPHRSMECSPCVHANISDLRLLDDARISEIEKLEQDMGFTSKGNPRVMFRPKRHKGAVGIRAVVEWAKIPRKRDQIELEELILNSTSGCNSGYCGD